MSIEFISGSIAFITSFIGLFPQIVKALRTQSTQDLSMIMLLNYFICSLAWIVYGGTTASWFVLSSNVVGLLVCLLLIFIKYYYDARTSRSQPV